LISARNIGTANGPVPITTSLKTVEPESVMREKLSCTL
jgi:hypothetical protein